MSGPGCDARPGRAPRSPAGVGGRGADPAVPAGPVRSRSPPRLAYRCPGPLHAVQQRPYSRGTDSSRRWGASRRPLISPSVYRRPVSSL